MGLAGGLVLSVLLTGVGVLPWPVQLLVDLALVGYVIHLRGEARRAAAARARRGPAAGAARVAASARAVSPVGAPPVGPPLGAPPPSRREPAAFEPAEEPLERAVGLGDAWEPVPVPPPTYVTKSGSPEAPQHIVDLTHAGTGEIEDAIAEQVTEPLPRRPGLIDDLELWEDDEYGLDEILDGRRAVGD
jgi:hypothetical protein